MNDDSNTVLIIVILIVALFPSLCLTKCIVESDMPLWLKIWMLLR